jgi:hypothetical protein
VGTPRPPHLWFLLLLVLASLLVAPLAPAAGPKVPDGAAIVRGAGRARAEGAQEWTPISTGSVLGPGMSVEASPQEPLEMNLPDGVEIMMEPGCVAQWRFPGRLPTERNGWARGYHLNLREGEIHVHVPSEPRGSRAFLVSTTAGTLTAWRGSVHVTVHQDTTAAAIYEGALVIGSNGQGFPVYDGAGVLMRKGINPDKSRVIPQAPAWANASAAAAAPLSFAVVRAEEHPKLGFVWGPVPSAASYRVEVATDAGMMHVVHRAPADTTSFTLPDTVQAAGGGRFFARVRAVGSEGIVGNWNTPTSMRFVRVKLPPRAFIAKDGAIVVPQGAAVGLSDAEGIEVAYENVDAPGRALSGARVAALYYMTAPSVLRLGEAPVRVVHLRDAVLGSASDLVLARRQLHADVDLCPQRATWPADEVHVRVEIADPSGRIDPAGEQFLFETTVNLDTVSAAWMRTGNTFTTRIAPVATPGPWVARVVVKDASGEEIGRGLLEIVSAGAATVRRDTTEVRVFH